MTESEFQSMSLQQHNALPNRERADRYMRMTEDQRKRLLAQAPAPMTKGSNKTAGRSWDAIVKKFAPGQKP